MITSKELRKLTDTQLRQVQKRAGNVLVEREQDQRESVPQEVVDRLYKKYQESSGDESIEITIPATIEVDFICIDDEYETELNNSEYVGDIIPDLHAVVNAHPDVKKQLKVAQKSYSDLQKEVEQASEECGITSAAMWELIEG